MTTNIQAIANIIYTATNSKKAVEIKPGQTYAMADDDTASKLIASGHARKVESKTASTVAAAEVKADPTVSKTATATKASAASDSTKASSTEDDDTSKLV